MATSSMEKPLGSLRMHPQSSEARGPHLGHGTKQRSALSAAATAPPPPPQRAAHVRMFFLPGLTSTGVLAAAGLVAAGAWRSAPLPGVAPSAACFLVGGWAAATSGAPRLLPAADAAEPLAGACCCACVRTQQRHRDRACLVVQVLEDRRTSSCVPGTIQ